MEDIWLVRPGVYSWPFATTALGAFLTGCQSIRREKPGLVLAYHDRSDGGLFTTLAEMAFAGRVGVDANIDALSGDAISALFNEELGAVFQIRKSDYTKFNRAFATCGPPKGLIKTIGFGKSGQDQNLTVKFQGKTVVNLPRGEMQQW